MPSPIVINSTTNLNGKRLLKAEDFLSYRVEDYGAVGDGVTDDTAAIQSAITAALVTGGTVYFGGKVYAVTATINIIQAGARPVHLVGMGRYLDLQVAGTGGTKIKYTNGVGTTKIINFTNCNGSSMQGFTIDCGTANTGLWVESVVACKFEDIDISNSQLYAFRIKANAAGVYHCWFNNLSSDKLCHSGMILESQDISVNNCDIAQCTFSRLDLNYKTGVGLDLTSVDNALFIGLVVICWNGAVAGEAIMMRDRTVQQFGCCFNTFIQIDGNTVVGPAKGVKVDVNPLYPNVAYGFDFGNGLIISTTSLHVESLLLEDTTGFKQTNLLQWVSGKAFGGSTVLHQAYFDTSANKFRFQSHQAAVRRGWIFSGNAGAGAEVVAFEIDPDGNLFQKARTAGIGEFSDLSRAVGTFLASAGTWTVTDPGDITNLRWCLTGSKLHLEFDLNTTSVSNAGVVLRLLLPNGYIIKNTTRRHTRSSDNGAGFVSGMCLAAAGVGYLQFFSTLVGAGYAIAVNTTAIQGDIDLEIT